MAVGHDDLAPDKRVARIRGLLKGLPGPLGNGEMLVWVNPGDAESVPQDVFTLVEGVDDRLERWGPGGSAASVPANPADLMTKLGEVEQPAAVDVLGWLLSTTMAYGGPGRYGERKARDVVNTLVGLLGHAVVGQHRNCRHEGRPRLESGHALHLRRCRSRRRRRRARHGSCR